MTVPEIQIGTVVLMPPDALEPMSDQPRQERDEAFIRDLAANIASLRTRGLGIQGTGFLEALTARLPSLALDAQGRLNPGVRLPLTSGETRWRATNLANEDRPGAIPLLPLIIENVSADDAFELAYQANAQRRQMSALDEGLALLRIKRRHGLGYDRLAARVNQSPDRVRTLLKAVGEVDTLPILEKRPDAVWIVRRINQVEAGDFRDELIESAMKGATKADIEDAIAAKRAGLTVGQFCNQREIRKYENAHTSESKSAKSSAPSSLKSGDKPRSSSPSAGAADESEDENNDESAKKLAARPYVGDALDVLTRQLEEAKTGLLEAKLPPDRRADLISKAQILRDLTDELLAGLQKGAAIAAN